MTTTEYAIFNERGEQFGLPARSWPDRDTAQSALDFLLQRRQEMAEEARSARDEIQVSSTFGKELSRQRRVQLADLVARWDKESVHEYVIMRRDVSPWVVAE